MTELAPDPRPLATHVDGADKVTSAIDVDTAQVLVNDIYRIALALTPLAATPRHNGNVTGLLDDLDALIPEIRHAILQDSKERDGPIHHVRTVLADLQPRLAACWATELETGSDPHRADRLVEASRLVRGTLATLTTSTHCDDRIPR